MHFDINVNGFLQAPDMLSELCLSYVHGVSKLVTDQGKETYGWYLYYQFYNVAFYFQLETNVYAVTNYCDIFI